MNLQTDKYRSIVASQLPLRRGDKGLSKYIASKVDSDVSAESICGDNDSQDVEFYDGSRFVTAEFVNSHQRPVCQVQWNTGLRLKYNDPGNVNGIPWTTGTLIDTDLMVTAGHTFDRFPGRYNVPRIDGTDDSIYPEEIATNLHVNFNYQWDPIGQPRPVQSFSIIELVEYRLGDLDFAIARLDGKPGSIFGLTKISSIDCEIGDILCIIGHPQTLPKRIDSGHCYKLEGDLIYYNDIDTLGGDSGSGILIFPSGRIIGIHTNGGCDDANVKHNHGQRISSMLAVSPTLKGLAT